MLAYRITFFDLETGGLDPERHPIIQIGAWRVNHEFTKWSKFECKVKFDINQCTQEALSINSYNEALWAEEAVEPTVAAKRFATFLKEGADVVKMSKKGRPYKIAQMAAHNADFDRSFLLAFYKSLDIFLPASLRMIDTIELARLASTLCGDTPDSFSLANLTRYYDVPLENAHDALADAKATAMLGKRLLQKLSGVL